MLQLLKAKADQEIIKKVAEDFEGYVKVVVDIERKILTAGGTRQGDGEQLLSQDGSQQKDLWGGGIDLETGEVDFDSMINLRPADNNASREVLSLELREKAEKIIRQLPG